MASHSKRRREARERVNMADNFPVTCMSRAERDTQVFLQNIGAMVLQSGTKAKVYEGRESVGKTPRFVSVREVYTLEDGVNRLEVGVLVTREKSKKVPFRPAGRLRKGNSDI